MTKLECGCRIMSDVINLNADDRNNPAWSYMMKTYSNICGRHSHRQLKFQYMENKLLEMEKDRVRMFMEENDEDDEEETREPDPEEETEEEEEETPYEELKAYLKDMKPEDRLKYRQFETLRNLANGLSPNYKMDDINKTIKELESEEAE